MNSLGYTYKTTSDIIEIIPHLSDFSTYQFSMLFSLIGISLFLIYYLLPAIGIIYKYKQNKQKILERKKFIKMIAMQKEIEDEIIKEMEEDTSK